MPQDMIGGFKNGKKETDQVEKLNGKLETLQERKTSTAL
jgi:hypothetical protein